MRVRVCVCSHVCDWEKSISEQYKKIVCLNSLRKLQKISIKMPLKTLPLIIEDLQMVCCIHINTAAETINWF